MKGRTVSTYGPFLSLGVVSRFGFWCIFPSDVQTFSHTKGLFVKDSLSSPTLHSASTHTGPSDKEGVGEVGGPPEATGPLPCPGRSHPHLPPPAPETDWSMTGTRRWCTFGPDTGRRVGRPICFVPPPLCHLSLGIDHPVSLFP